MADFAPTGQPRSIAAPLDGPSNPAVYVLPQGVAFDLQAVYVDIDASGAGATTATLTIRDSSGAVIAKKRQGETVNAGAIGSATWALRLDDSAAAAAGLAPLVSLLSGNATSINNNFVGNLTWNTQNYGTALLNRSVLTAPTVVAAGLYAINVTIAPTTAMTVGGKYQATLALSDVATTVTMSELSPTATAGNPGGFPRVQLSIVWQLAAGGLVLAQVQNNDGATRSYRILEAAVVKIG